jgi:palmitoyltransferase
MVLVVLLIFGWSWYVHVLIMDRALLSADLALGLADLAVWHLLLVCAICAYLRTVFTQPGYTTTGQGANSLQALEAGLSDAVRDARFCQICSSYKPQRCHHCRMCGRCVEKMDHHCPWVANCVGKNNHKFFILFLLYTSLVANYNVLTIALWCSRNPQTIFVSFSDRILHCGVTVDYTQTSSLAVSLLPESPSRA